MAGSSLIQRQQIRDKYGIQEGDAPTGHELLLACCCLPLSLFQAHVTLRERAYWAEAANMQGGWVGRAHVTLRERAYWAGVANMQGGWVGRAHVWGRQQGG